MEYLSKQRYDEIAAELDHLISVVYPEVRDNVAETSAQGDRSENAGYREAKRMQAKTITLQSKKSGRFVEMGIQGFPNLCLWGVPTRMSLIAIEPWIGISDRVDTDHIWEHKPGIQSVQPGETNIHTLTFRVG